MRALLSFPCLLLACEVAPDAAFSGPSGDHLDALATEQAPPPSGGILTTSAAVVGQPLRLRSVGHPSTSNVFFARGAAGSACPPALGGQCLDIASPTLLGSDPSDGQRTAEMQILIPARTRPGLSTLIQAANPTTTFQTIISNTASLRIEGSSPCAAGQVTLIRNSMVELPPVAGEFTQAYGGGSLTTFFDTISGSTVLQVTGNEDLTIDFQSTPVVLLAEAGFWTWHDPADSAVQSWSVYYTDGSSSSGFVFNTTTGTGWEYIDLLPSLDPSKTAHRLEAWGYSGGAIVGPDITRFDGLNFCSN